MPSPYTGYRTKKVRLESLSRPHLPPICCAENLQPSTFEQDPGLMIQLQSPSRHSGSIIYFDIDVGLQASKDGCLQEGNSRSGLFATETF